MKLSIVGGPGQGRSFELAPGNNFIGRAEENSIVLSSGQVSRRHACVSVVDNRVFVEDLGSSNGTHMGGQPLTKKVELQNGVPFQVGEFVLQLGEPVAQRALGRAGPAPVRGTIPSGARPGAPFPSPMMGGVVQVGGAGDRLTDTPFWKFYKAIRFLGWRGQVIFLSLLASLALTALAVLLPLQQSHADLEAEVLRRGEVLVKNLAMRNGEFIKKREETNLDTASFLLEQGVSGAFLLSKELTILSPVEQRGNLKLNNDVSRQALRRGLVSVPEDEVKAGGDSGTYHIAMPIKVWSVEQGTYDTYGVAYLIFQAKQVAARNFAANTKFVSSTVAIAIIMVLFIVGLFLLTGRPMRALRDDAELVLRGDLSKVESRARWKELVDLSHSLNRSFERAEQAAEAASNQLGAAEAVQAAPQPGSLGGSTGSTSGDAKVEAISNAVAEGVLITDDMQRVVYLNKRAERQFGVPLSRVKDRHVMEVITNQDILGGVLDLFKQLMNTEEEAVSVTVSVSEGGQRTVNIVGSGVRGANQQLEYAAIVIR